MGRGVDYSLKPTAKAMLLAIHFVICFAAAALMRVDKLVYQQYSPDLFLCMEKIETIDDAVKWKRLVGWADNESIGAPSNLKAMVPGRPEIFHKFRSGSGGAARQSIENSVGTFGSDHPNDIWVAFLWSSTTPPPSPITLECIWNIEMSMTVSTAPPYLYTWHMGITRNFYTSVLEHFVIHKNCSDLLHGFAAKVMKLEHPELFYVRSRMAKMMVDILERVFEDHKGTRIFTKAPIPQVSFGDDDRCTLYSLDLSERLWEGSCAVFDFPKYPGGSLNVPFLADINLLAEVV